MKDHNYFVYILTNKIKTVLYIEVTNDLVIRLFQHKKDSFNAKKHFTGKYNCTSLIYYDRFENINQAIDREKQLKGWTRKKKEGLINTINPDWEFLNNKIN
jgi:putative endonuclease